MTALSIHSFSLSDIRHLTCFDQKCLSDFLLLSQTDFSVNFALKGKAGSNCSVGWAYSFSDCFCRGGTEGRKAKE